MEIIRVIILVRGIDNTIWPKVVFAIIYIKNLYLTQVLKSLISPAKIQDKDLLNKNFSNLYHFCILGLTIYIFFHKKKYILKSTKWDIKVLKKSS